MSQKSRNRPTRVSPLATAEDASFILSVALVVSLRAFCFTLCAVDSWVLIL